jgi:hypothetical protein
MRTGFPPIPDWTPEYRKLVRAIAREMDSDGCSLPALSFRVDACYEHDIHWRTGHTVYGHPIPKATADTVFRWRLQAMSPLGVISPVAWWRYLGVTIARKWSEWTAD